MAEIAGSFLGPVIEVAKWVAAPIMRQFNYLCCFTSNITHMKNEGKELEVAAGDLQLKVDRARDNVQVISGEVESWLEKSNGIKDEMDWILNEIPNVESSCLKLIARFSLSKKAKKTTDRLKELRGQCNFNDNAISQPRPPPAREAIPLGRICVFESQKQIEEDIMKTLKLGDVNTVGICGMGGLGKTTMAKRIMNRALEEHVFEEVVMAVVSQPVDKLKIQVEIGGTLGLNLEGETYQSRLQRLHARLSGTKRILLVLDDLWKRLVLEDLGIPCNLKGCTILLTSRNHDVFNEMDVQKILQMEVLSKEDAWLLFGQRAGACVDDTGLSSIAKEVVNECKGLPLALATVGCALKDKMDVRIWKDALRRLRQSDPSIPGLLRDVYNPLKLSYDALDPEDKSLFLLCCLYPEDTHISIEQLTYFSMGLSIFEGITNVEDARNSMCSLASKLKSRSLLLDSERGDDYVRMHDVVRDVCIFIAKQERYIGGNDCSWISSYQKHEIPSVLGFPNLRLIFWVCDSANAELKVDSNFFEGIRDLYVLYIESDLLTSLPFTTQSLKNLKTLIINSCNKLETLSSIGELVSLEILVCRYCDSIKELPREMEGLTRLKVLDLTRCENLQRIGRGIISSLVGLEELKMKGSFKKWEAEDREVRENAGLKELEALTKLKCLEIDIEDPALAAENMRLSTALDRFNIKITSRYSHYAYHGSLKLLLLHWEEESRLGDWIQMQLLKDAEILILKGNSANNVDLAKSHKIKVLELRNCESMKKMVTTSMEDGGASHVLTSIQDLRLYSLPKFEEISNGPVWWLSLKKLHIFDLPELKQFWKGSSVHLRKDFLPQLQSLSITKCEKMEQVFKWDENENNSCHHHITKMLFPKLKHVSLIDLPNLTSFCHEIQGIEFLQLSTLEVERCGKLNWKVSEGNDNNSVGGGGSSSNAHIQYPSSQPQEVSLRCLKALTTDWNPCGGHKMHISIYNGLEKLHISEYQGSMSLFSTSITGALVNLTKLTIQHCGEMVKVISDEEEVVSGGERDLFPKLQELNLYMLSKLVSFCKWKCDVELPSLRRVVIIGCPKMKNFSLGPLTTPNLESFDTDLDNNIQVLFNSMPKELNISENDKPLNSYNIHESLFNRLEVLCISAYKGSMSLFSTSITGALVNLTKLTISFCYEIVKVISDEEEAVSGGESALIFPKLQELELVMLPKLVSFGEWKCDVELPSLSKVQISNCPNMKIFCLGSLTTPNLTSVELEYKDFNAAKDLNDALKEYWCMREKQR